MIRPAVVTNQKAVYLSSWVYVVLCLLALALDPDSTFSPMFNGGYVLTLLAIISGNILWILGFLFYLTGIILVLNSNPNTMFAEQIKMNVNGIEVKPMTTTPLKMLIPVFMVALGVTMYHGGYWFTGPSFIFEPLAFVIFRYQYNKNAKHYFSQT